MRDVRAAVRGRNILLPCLRKAPSFSGWREAVREALIKAIHVIANG